MDDQTQFQQLEQKVSDLSDALDAVNYQLYKKTGPDSNSIQGSKMQSTNFVKGSSGWELTPDGNLEANAGVFRGSLTANSLDIPDTVTANSFHVDTAGNAWWGATTFGAAIASISKAGAGLFSSIAITGGSISGLINSAATDLSLMDMTHNLVFSVTDADTIAWTSGTIAMSNGRTFSISSGNTGNMAALTYIYLDPAISTTVLQTTTTYSTAIGNNKRLIGTAQNNTVTASYIPYGPGAPLIDGANIGALSIVAGNIAASTITAAKLTVSQLSAIAADMGTLTAGTITLNTAGYVRGGATDYLTGTGFFLGYSGAAYKFSVGNPAANYIGWDGTTLTIIGNQVDVQTFDSTGTWTMPTGAKTVVVQAWGGGGGGGSDNAAGTAAGGGGGGAYNTFTYNASDLTSPVTVTIPAAAAGGGAGTDGTTGGTVTFGTYLSAFGGGGGGSTTAGGQAAGGSGGGGITAAGAKGTNVGAGGAGGDLVGSAAGASNGGFGGAGGGAASTGGGAAVYGGSGGGGGAIGGSVNGGAGGAAVYGAGGGGGGSLSGTGGAGGVSQFGGAGGAGGSAANGSNGVAPGGGGGGSATNGGTSGTGAKGRIRVTSYK